MMTITYAASLTILVFCLLPVSGTALSSRGFHILGTFRRDQEADDGFHFRRGAASNAAALFVDFLLSKPGQEVMASQGRWVSRNDAGYLVDLKGKRMQILLRLGTINRWR